MLCNLISEKESDERTWIRVGFDGVPYRIAEELIGNIWFEKRVLWRTPGRASSWGSEQWYGKNFLEILFWCLDHVFFLLISALYDINNILFERWVSWYFIILVAKSHGNSKSLNYFWFYFYLSGSWFFTWFHLIFCPKFCAVLM